MPVQALFGINVAFGFIAWGIVAASVIWPELRARPREEALRALLMLHIFRFVGLAFIIPGVVSPDLPSGFALDAAYGDLIAALLALLSLASLRTQAGLPLVWIFNVWGTLDLINAIYQGNAWSMSPGQLGAAYFIPTLIVPLLFITHALVFRLLLERAPVEATA